MHVSERMTTFPDESLPPPGLNGESLTRTRTVGIRVDSIQPCDTRRLAHALCHAKGPVIVTFVNPASIKMAERDPGYRQLLDAFDIVLPDGIGMCFAMRRLHGVPATRVSFDTTSLAPAVFQLARNDGRTVALIGGRPGVAECGAGQLQRAYPGLAITASLDGYGDMDAKIRHLTSLAPSIVVCGMGAGAQERLLCSLVQAGWSGTGFTCGGYLDQLAKGLHYYPRWVDAANLRWAYRLLKEPRRLAWRYSVDYAFFAARVGRTLLAQTASQRNQAIR